MNHQYNEVYSWKQALYTVFLYTAYIALTTVHTIIGAIYFEDRLSASRKGWMSWCHRPGDSIIWWLLCLVVERPWSALGEPLP